MSWSFFFMLVGVGTLAAQVLRVVDYMEHPIPHSRHSAVAR